MNNEKNTFSDWTEYVWDEIDPYKDLKSELDEPAQEAFTDILDNI